MRKTIVLGHILAALVLSTGAAATQPGFPSSVNESAPWEPQPNALPTATNAVFPGAFPISSNESGPAEQHQSASRRGESSAGVGATGTVTGRSPSGTPWAMFRGVTPPYPSSSNEAGPVR